MEGLKKAKWKSEVERSLVWKMHVWREIAEAAEAAWKDAVARAESKSP
mgnify:CR=1 FL=1